MADQNIQVKIVGRNARAAYVSLPGHTHEPGVSARTVRLDSLLSYEGPMVNFDLDKHGRLIGIEILVFGLDVEEDDEGDKG